MDPLLLDLAAHQDDALAGQRAAGVRPLLRHDHRQLPLQRRLVELPQGTSAKLRQLCSWWGGAHLLRIQVRIGKQTKQTC